MVVQRSADLSQLQLVQADLTWHLREQSAQLVMEVETSGLSGVENFLPDVGQPENWARRSDNRITGYHLSTYT